MTETDNGMQMDLFDMMYPDFKFDTSKPVRLVELFAGTGTQRQAFERIGVDVDVVAIVEIDKHAVLSYAAMHTDYLKIRGGWFDDNIIDKETMVSTLQNKMVGFDFKHGRHTIHDKTNIETVRDFYLADLLSKNLGDVSKVKGGDLPQDIDMLTYSFPCTDLSKAGQQKGLVGTRSGLVYQVFRIVEELKAMGNMPKTLVMENVVDLIQRKFIKEFHEMQVEVENYGYINYTMRLNAKDYGVAQSRDRVFMLSIPKEHNYNEPVPFKLKKRLKDYLEDRVDESYYLSNHQVSQINSWNSQQNPIDNAKFEDSEFMQCLTAKGNTTLNASMLLLKEIKGGVAIPEATKKGYDVAYDGDSVSLDQPNSKTRRGRVGKQQANTLTTSCNQGVVVNAKTELCNRMLANGHLKESDMIRHSYTSERMDNIERTESTDGICATLTTRPDTLGVVVRDDIPICLNSKVNGKQPSLQDRIYSDQGTAAAITTGFHPNVSLSNDDESYLRIRKITPLEAFRLMGMDDKYYHRAAQVNSNSQLYKQAGNAIVVDVFAHIVKGLV